MFRIFVACLAFGAAVFLCLTANAALPAPQAAISIFEQLGVGPFDAVSADLNGNGNLDLAVVNFDSDNLLLFFGNGDDTFRSNSRFSYPVGSQPRSLAVGDLNGNGFYDIAVANSASQSLSIFFGDGQGGFVPHPSGQLVLGFGLVTVELADVNADGFLDILTSDFGGNAVKVLLNDGAGSFPLDARRRFPVGSGPFAVAVGDVNGDGALDIATANFNSGDVTLLLGDGAGVFLEAPGSPFRDKLASGILRSTENLPDPALLMLSVPSNIEGISVGVNPVRVKLVDVNGDGNLDILTANFTSGDMSVLLGDGSGYFDGVSGSPFSVGVSPRDMVVFDVNGSGALDAVIVSVEGDALFIMIGDGEGAFLAAPEGPFPVGESPASLVTGDFSNNGIPALATANRISNDVSILAGDGVGGFSPIQQSPLSFGSDPVDLVVGDLDGSGGVDIVVVRSASGDAIALYGDGRGRFDTRPNFAIDVGEFPKAAVLADFNGDGVLDLITSDFLANSLGFFLGDGGGKFSRAPGGPISVGINPVGAQVGDLNGNGLLDIVVANYGSNDISVLLGDGAGGFTYAPGSPFAVGADSPRRVALGDLNGNGILDVVSVNFRSNSISVLAGDGTGGFVLKGSPIPVGSEPVAVALGDLSGNGILDIATANSGSDNVSILQGDGDGGFAAASGSPLAVGSRPLALRIGDIDGDGNQDLVIGNFGSDSVTFYFGAGDGQFLQANGSPVFLPGGGPTAIELADVDGDGRLDVVVVGDRQGSFSEHVTVLTSDLLHRDRFEMRFLPTN